MKMQDTEESKPILKKKKENSHFLDSNLLQSYKSKDSMVLP
jgi:hypothetical protein